MLLLVSSMYPLLGDRSLFIFSDAFYFLYEEEDIQNNWTEFYRPTLKSLEEYNLYEPKLLNRKLQKFKHL